MLGATLRERWIANTLAGLAEVARAPRRRPSARRRCSPRPATDMPRATTRSASPSVDERLADLAK